ncbi:DNA-formamidopyrimidine glycosylase [Halioglobus japonicus]|uniref:Formamidopyrimidine-DNA glycosylase n=1 Tax=Halioglobus japonicus TaxID=930805 RepID=A0AAP8MCK9_9GAMM|nr:bifunctional DNA-formamidopyrimidine glycosylase/DNA-(apurinic or apyrimidinic site) lyase [Halioglobus japonicus]AQA17407.1 DNA-formamidopyrimidine glycosylase [Halioglobus japonicus]PLW85330.1 bifunctional DNA-formamidopyrimidine glycosylase/DNA-(apurinic or apyrimidinic site) lyase [Halioglobus japonicus]GHD22299.1 formamidopyrimidine-DNA glycosylase [Halioglobus japonicus]
MPELPEVETTRRGVEPYSAGQTIKRVIVRNPSLRWPVPASLPRKLRGQQVTAVERRAKYLLFRTAAGSMMIHLGMSGSLRVVDAREPPGKHDHIDIVFEGGRCLRYNDPRRFGCCLWLGPGESHDLLEGLGPEPLGPDFDGDLLFRRSRGRKVPVKQFVMDGKVVVGVGNIYANEALFQAGIRPDRPAGRISRARYERLAEEIKRVLTFAINQGGTTLRDFVGGDGKPGYFAQQLFVYGREGEPCKRCQRMLKKSTLGQRTTVYCVACQR